MIKDANNIMTHVYSAAGGNPTAINFGGNYDRSNYANINKAQQKRYEEIEQVGFYEKQDGLPRLQMAGGEFCGNATRSFACLLKDLNPEESEFDFYVSGYDHIVHAKTTANVNNYKCEVIFSNFNYLISEKKIDNKTLKIVDLGGIVHIVVDEQVISFDEKNFSEKMKDIKNILKVDCSAVGVVWVKRDNDRLSIKPVVWVKSIDTCYYETSCGSGSIAVGLVEKKDVEVCQPSGGVILVKTKGKALILESELSKIINYNWRID